MENEQNPASIEATEGRQKNMGSFDVKKISEDFPILNRTGVPVYFDKKVVDLKNVNLGSGDLTKGLDMKLSDLLSAVGEYEVVDLV